jgi:hypothetical protein
MCIAMLAADNVKQYSVCEHIVNTICYILKSKFSRDLANKLDCSIWATLWLSLWARLDIVLMGVLSLIGLIIISPICLHADHSWYDLRCHIGWIYLTIIMIMLKWQWFMSPGSNCRYEFLFIAATELKPV